MTRLTQREFLALAKRFPEWSLCELWARLQAMGER